MMPEPGSRREHQVINAAAGESRQLPRGNAATLQATRTVRRRLAIFQCTLPRLPKNSCHHHHDHYRRRHQLEWLHLFMLAAC